jgi:hypothetical protein
VTRCRIPRRARLKVMVWRVEWRWGVAQMRCALLSFFFWSEICGRMGVSGVSTRHSTSGFTSRTEYCTGGSKAGITRTTQV